MGAPCHVALPAALLERAAAYAAGLASRGVHEVTA